MKIIEMCSAHSLCTKVATRWIRLRNGDRVTKPIAVCDEHLSYGQQQARDAGVGIDVSGPINVESVPQ